MFRAFLRRGVVLFAVATIASFAPGLSHADSHDPARRTSGCGCRSRPDPQDLQQERLASLTRRAEQVIAETGDELHRVFKLKFEPHPSLQLLNSQEFFVRTGAPLFTKALYYEGNILLPADQALAAPKEALRRTLRHECLHAFVRQVSAGLAPAWFDEGLAQHFEGRAVGDPSDTRRLAAQALAVKSLRELDRTLFHGDKEDVSSYYALSLVAVRTLINRFGIRSAARFLELLGGGSQQDEAFTEAFGLLPSEFEAQLRAELSRLSRNGL